MTFKIVATITSGPDAGQEYTVEHSIRTRHEAVRIRDDYRNWCREDTRLSVVAYIDGHQPRHRREV